MSMGHDIYLLFDQQEQSLTTITSSNQINMVEEVKQILNSRWQEE